MLEVVRNPGDVRELVAQARSRGLSVGFVPTMGGLHEGHLELVRQSRAACGFTVVSLFVNPIQFGAGEDFSKYPRMFERDRALCEQAGVDVLFAPEAQAMYPEGFQTKVRVEEIAKPLCGASRIGHFDGVATVVLKLFNLVGPDVAFFGEKDFQQLQVIRRMVRDLDVPVRIQGVPIVREPDGLAMSTRNQYLSPDERERALALSRSLALAQRLAAGGETDAAKILEVVRALLDEAGVGVEYAELRNPEDLTLREVVDAPTLLALAARVGTTRLIDNRIIGPASGGTMGEAS